MSKIEIIEVGPRDGLQNESNPISVQQKVALVERLFQAGLKRIEVGAFVAPQAVPQMADSGQVVKRLSSMTLPKHRFLVLVPNARGLDDALEAGAREIAVFTAASETFNQKNIRCSIDESFRRIQDVLKRTRGKRIKIRGYVSMAFGCPFEGAVPTRKVYEVTERLLDLGVSEVSIGDTIGVATPRQVRTLLKGFRRLAPPQKLALHFHDTRGLALANVVEALDHDISKFDSSIGGLGGCPYAPGATGNLATEDLVYLLHGMGLPTGIDLPRLIETNAWLAGLFERPLPSRVSRAKNVPSYIFSKP